MLGLGDIWVSLAYILCLASAMLCVVYGALNWNSEGQEPVEESYQWAEEETKIEKSF